jgi:phage/plasmid primase-like uncharacterized protein
MASTLLNRARGRWREILLYFGMAETFLSGDNGPCPLCPQGGVDRFHFSDRHDSGSYYCRQCRGGNGFTLLRKFKKWDDATAMREIEAWLDSNPAPDRRAAAYRRNERRRKTVDEMISDARRLVAAANDPRIVDQLLTPRCVSVRSSELRGHARCPFWDRKLPHLNGRQFDAVLAPITAPYRGIVDVQRIYCSTDIPEKQRKKSLPGERRELLLGSSVRLFAPVDGVMAVCEGVITALSFAELFGVPTWAAGSDWGVENWRWPPDTRHVLIGADNDASCAGQRAAHALAKRLEGAGLTAEIHLPPDVDTDWNDVLMARRQS